MIVADQRMYSLLTRLIARTEAGSVQWERGGREESYIYSLPDASVVIETKDRDDSHPYRFRVVNDMGDTVDEITVSPFEASSSEAEELYRLAKRSALRVDETLDALLSRLDDDLPF